MTIQEKYLKIVDEVIEKGPYKPDWVSLSEYEAPKWFRMQSLEFLSTGDSSVFRLQQ